MDKFINQPAEDRETNQLCIRYHMLQCDVVNIRTRMEERYEYDLEYQRWWLDDHIKKMESRLQLLMTTHIIFIGTFTSKLIY